jgi:hypothetical protein
MNTEDQLAALERTKNLIEKELYTQLMFLGIDPDSFSTDEFDSNAFLASAPENPTNFEWLAYLAIARFVPRLKTAESQILEISNEV